MQRRDPGKDTRQFRLDTTQAFIRLDTVLVDHCEFLRRKDNSGRVIHNYYSSNIFITNNRFGGDDPETTGYFVTAIKERGTNSLIQGNTIRKSKSWAPRNFQDHGIYAVDFNGVTIRDNTISGWPPNQAGGAVKARNGQHMVIENNDMETSGILLYTYEIKEGSDTQRYLNDVMIKNNNISISGKLDLNDPNIYHGISYYNNAYPEKGQKSIRIKSNTVGNGYMKFDAGRINPRRFSADGGGIFDNTAEAYWIKAGIDHSGNAGDVYTVN